MACMMIQGGVIDESPTFAPGDQAPEGYLAWHEWAEIQHKAGLRQTQCGRCGLWKYPQELSSQLDRYEACSRSGSVQLASSVCNDCHSKDNPRPEQD